MDPSDLNWSCVLLGCFYTKVVLKDPPTNPELTQTMSHAQQSSPCFGPSDSDHGGFLSFGLSSLNQLNKHGEGLQVFVRLVSTVIIDDEAWMFLAARFSHTT